MQKKIVITGGPGSGKSTVLKELMGKDFFCMPEISREVTLKARANGIEHFFLNDPIIFSKLLLEGRKNQYRMAEDSGAELVFFDRGLPDVNAYLDYLKIDYNHPFKKASQKYTYEKAFIMPPWKAIYAKDNERYENFEEASTIHQFIELTYKSLGYELILVPMDSVKNRVDFILNNI